MTETPEISFLKTPIDQFELPSKLVKKLPAFGLLTVGDVINCDPYRFSQYPSVGNKTVQIFNDFRQALINDPDSLPRIKPMERKVLSITGSYNLQVFLQLVEAYGQAAMELEEQGLKDYKHAARDHQLFCEYIGLGCEERTIGQISHGLALSSERVRQLVQNQVNMIKRSLSGTGSIVVSDEMYAAYQTSLERIENNFVLDTKTLSAQFDIDVLNAEVGQSQQLNIFVETLGFQLLAFNNTLLSEMVLWVKPSAKVRSIRNQYIALFKLIRAHARGLTFEKIRTQWKHQDIPLLTMLETTLGIEKDEDRFQVDLGQLPKLSDVAERILHKLGRIANYQELHTLINETLAPYGKSYELEQIKINVKRTSHLLPLGRSGYFALREWGVREGSQIELIEAALQEAGKPLSTDEILQVIQESYQRVDVSADNLRSALSVYLNKRVWADERGVYSIKEGNLSSAANRETANNEPEVNQGSDSLLGSERVSKPDQALQKRERLAQLILAILRNSPDHKLPLRDLLTKLMVIDSSIQQAYMYKIIREYPYLFKNQELDNLRKEVVLTEESLEYGRLPNYNS